MASALMRLAVQAPGSGRAIPKDSPSKASLVSTSTLKL
jgi:hypothetical protein